MANFTDTQLVPFSQLSAFPVDLYGRVGMMKQAQYDANTAKVQAYYDSIAGLDIIKDTDKSYLNGKLNGLQSDLAGLANADFSKQSVVNRAASLAAPIAKDQNLQTAVIATAQYKDGINKIKKAQADGTANPSNTWDYMSEGNKWLSDGQVGSSFNYSYTPYRDVRKKVVEAFKAIHQNVQESDIVFNSDGSLRDDLIRNKIAGISPQQIKNVLSSSLDAGDFKQLDIDGRYQYQNYTPEKLKETISNYSASTLKELQDKRDDIKNQMSGSSGDAYSSLQDKYEQLGQHIKDIENNISSYYDQIDQGDLEGAKSLFHTNSFINNYANALSYTEISQTHQTNPGMQTALEKLKMQKDENHFQLTYQQKEREIALKAKENAPFGDLTMQVAHQEINQGTIENALTAEKKILDSSQKQMEARHADGDPNWFNTQQALYNRGAFKNMSPDVVEYFKLREIQESDYKAHLANYTKIVDEANKKYPINIPNDIKGVSFEKDGKIYNFTPAQVYSYTQKQDNFLQQSKQFEESPRDLLDSETRDKKAQGYRQLYQSYLNSLTPEEKEIQALRGTSTAFDFHIGNTSRAVNRIASDQIKKRDAEITQKLQESTGLGTQQYVTLGRNEEQRKDLRGKVGSYISNLESNNQDLGTEGIQGNDISDIKEALGSDETTFRLVRNPGGSLMGDRYGISISGTVKGKPVEAVLPITETQKKEMFGNVDVGESGSFTEKTKMRILGGKSGTTNPLGISNINTALENPYLRQTHFPNVKNYAVKGDIYTGLSPESVNAKLYVFDPETKRYVLVDLSQNMQDYGSLNYMISTLDDSRIFQLLHKGRKPTQQELDQLESLSTVK